MNFSGRLKPLSYLFALYVILFFCVVIPFHHHADYSAHDDCPICAVSNQSIATDVAAPVHILFVLFAILFIGKQQVPFFSVENLHLRSPPLA